MSNRRETLQTLIAAGVGVLAAPWLQAAPARLKLLILGGTGFLGPEQVNDALARGHEVTLFNRGVSAAGLYGGRVEVLRGNRDTRTAPGLEALAGTRRWDVVIDNSGYLPRHVRDSAELLRDRCEQYIFISTGAVYDFAKREVCDETGPLQQLADPASEIENGQTYGPLKVECEKAVLAAFGARATLVRPTFVFGPGDDTDRFTYWIERIARGGAVLGPTFPELGLQWVDVRDLCPWLIRLAESRTTGTFNVAGPTQSIAWREVLESLKVKNAPATALHWATPEILEELKISLPLAAARRRSRRMVSDAAQRAGLRYRPLADTVAATRAWWAALPPARRAKPERWPDPVLEREALKRLGVSPA
jgi:2'-hydroxyisoflavone reductase